MSGNPEFAYPADGFGYAAPPPPPRRRANTGMIGTALSVAGVIAFAAAVVSIYGEGGPGASNGVPPVIRADGSPTKMRPERPGGMEVPHQDKLVYERLSAGGSRPAVERLLPPPEEPLPRPLVAAVPPPPAAVVPPAVAPAPVPAAAPPAVPSAAVTAATAPAVAAPTPVAAAVAQPVVPATTTVAPPPPAVAATTAAAVAATPPTQRPAPAPRPTASLGSLPRELFETAAAVPLPASLGSSARPPAGSAAVGAAGAGWRVQLASVRSEAEAQAEWKRLVGRFPDALGGASAQIIRNDLGERGIYYRVAGAGLSEERARAACARLKEQNVGCLVVRP